MVEQKHKGKEMIVYSVSVSESSSTLFSLSDDNRTKNKDLCGGFFAMLLNSVSFSWGGAFNSENCNW